MHHGDGRSATWNMWNVKSRTFFRLELSESGTGGRALVPDFHLERGAHQSGTDLERSLSVSLEFLTRLEWSGTIFAGTHWPTLSRTHFRQKGGVPRTFSRRDCPVHISSFASLPRGSGTATIYVFRPCSGVTTTSKITPRRLTSSATTRNWVTSSEN